MMEMYLPDIANGADRGLAGGMRLVRKKAWSEMTERQVNELKEKQCRKCAYFTESQTSSVVSGICEYLAMEGHRRGCSPLDCVERGIFKPKKKG